MTMKTSRGVGLACALLLTSTACGGGQGTSATPTASPTKSATPSAAAAPAEAEVDQCTTIAGAASYLDMLVFANIMDDPKLSDRLAKAEAAFADTEPPAELTEDWKTVAEFFGVISKAFAGVDPTDGDQLRKAQATLGDGIDAQAAAAGEAGIRITSYGKKNCAKADDAVAFLTDACDLLTKKELRKVFPADDPVAEGKDFGKDFLECIWTGKTAKASVMVMPLDKLKADYLDKSTPLSAVEGLENGNAYRGTIGIGRLSSKGHAVSFSHGDLGGFVSVQTGDRGSRVVDVPIASDLAKAAAGRL